MFSKIKNLEVYPTNSFKERWALNEVSEIMSLLPEPEHLFCYLPCPSDWREQLVAEAVKTGRATMVFTYPLRPVSYKLVLEYEGEGAFKYMNVPDCFNKYEGPMKFKVDEKHLKLFLSHTLMDYRNINIKPKFDYYKTTTPNPGTGWGKTLKATTGFINKLYDVSEENIIIALKLLCEHQAVTHAGLNFIMADCSKAIVNISRSNSKYYRPKQVVIDNNVIDEIIAAPMPVVKKKDKKYPEGSLLSALNKIGEEFRKEHGDFTGGSALKFD